eukprot:TRINITY_DN1952_c0_g2_i1.p1 TRINITY_DN1952_c0_g2~~TRINITY_DN1952_c0_g2_i1.p1  ORF type:complete len:503 (+),score=120.94 TRINITY_DN1952_c0_g2_i1:62-1570(+)
MDLFPQIRERFQENQLLFFSMMAYIVYSIYYFNVIFTYKQNTSILKWIPLFGPLVWWIKVIGFELKYALDTWLFKTQKYGSVWASPLCPGMETYLFSSDPKCNEHILKTNFNNYVKGDRTNMILAPLFGNGIFASDGKHWKKQRQVASHLFKTAELKQMIPVFIKHTDKLIELLEQNNNRDHDFQDVISRVTLDSIGEIAFGIDLGSLNDEMVPFANAFNGLQISVAKRFNNPLVMVLGPLRTLFFPTELTLERDAHIINDYAYSLIRKRRLESSLNERPDLLSRFLMLRDDEGQPYSDQDLRDVVINFITAGRDTTAETTTFVLYLLAQNPKVEKKLLQEIENELHGIEPDFDNMKNLKYLEAVIDETLRLFPAVPYDPKRAVEDDVLPDGTKVRKGTVVFWSAYIMGRSEELWDNPEEFRPERWLGENGGIQVDSINAIPFQLGPRICLGMNMAYLEMKIVIIKLLRRFKLEVPSDFKLNLIPSITMFSSTGVKIHVKSR